jgi:hypothetical protein
MHNLAAMFTAVSTYGHLHTIALFHNLQVYILHRLRSISFQKSIRVNYLSCRRISGRLYPLPIFLPLFHSIYLSRPLHGSWLCGVYARRFAVFLFTVDKISAIRILKNMPIRRK